MPKKEVVVSTVPLEERETKQKRKGIRVTFDKPVRTNRPTTVYLETMMNPESGETVEVLWYHTEQGQEVGREPVIDEKRRAMDPDDKTLLGYDFTILATREEIDKVKKQAFGRTQYVKKDGEMKYLVSADSF